MKICLIALLSVISISAFANEEGAANPANLFPQKAPNRKRGTNPPKVTLSEPKFMAKVSGETITLKWNQPEGVNTYRIQVAKDPNFKWLLADEGLYQSNNFELHGLEKGKHYYWRVAARHPENDESHTQGFFSTSMFETN